MNYAQQCVFFFLRSCRLSFPFRAISAGETIFCNRDIIIISFHGNCDFVTRVHKDPENILMDYEILSWPQLEALTRPVRAGVLTRPHELKSFQKNEDRSEKYHTCGVAW